MNKRPHALHGSMLLVWSALLLAIAATPAVLNAQTKPTLTLVSPRDGDTIDGPLTVRVEHGGIRFDGTVIGTQPTPGVGHWHVNIDGKFAGLAVSDVVEIPNDAFPRITAGKHTLTVNLHENNHALTEPVAEQGIVVNYARDVTLTTDFAAPPSLAILDQGQDGRTDEPLLIRVAHTGIRLDGAAIGTDPAAGVGHYHVDVDGKFAGLAVSSVIEVPNDALPEIGPGPHTITLGLRQNNHAVVDPPVERSFAVQLSQALRAGQGIRGPEVAAPPADPAAEHADPVAEHADHVAQLPDTGRPDGELTSMLLAALLCLLVGAGVTYQMRSRAS